MSEGFTPGPWRACSSGQIVAGAMSRQIARIWNTKNRERDTANARLIAAAPDLLAALEAVDREHDLLLAMKSCIASRPQGVISIAVDDDEDAIAWRGYRDEAQKLVEARRAALAKARGTPC